jgi:hypothetical protein
LDLPTPILWCGSSSLRGDVYGERRRQCVSSFTAPTDDDSERVRRPGGVGVAEAATAQGNNFSWPFLRPDGVLLRRQRWGHGDLFRSRWLMAHRSGWEVRLLPSWFEDKEAALGHVDDWRVDKTRVSRGGICHRRRVLVHGRWSSGCIPGRCSFSVCFISLFGASVYCGYLQSLMAIGLLPTRGWRRRSSGDVRQQRSLAASTDRGFRALSVISVFLRGLCAIGRHSCLLYPSRMYLYLYVSLYGILNF